MGKEFTELRQEASASDLMKKKITGDVGNLLLSLELLRSEVQEEVRKLLPGAWVRLAVTGATIPGDASLFKGSDIINVGGIEYIVTSSGAQEFVRNGLPSLLPKVSIQYHLVKQ